MTRVVQAKADEAAILTIRAEYLRTAAELASGGLACGRSYGGASCPFPHVPLNVREACRLATGAARLAPARIAEVLLSGSGPSGTPLEGPELGLGATAAVRAWLDAGAADPSTIAETCGGRGRRRLKGAYYTEPAAVALMVRLAFSICARASLDRQGDPEAAERVRSGAAGRLLEGVRIVDPACGSGAFLSGALDELAGPAFVRSPGGPGASAEAGRAPGVRICGVDSDPVAVAACRYAVWNRARRHGGCPFDVPAEVECGDALLGAPAVLSEPYDIVLMNPPYVRHELIPPTLKRSLREAFPSFCSRSDLYVYFFAVAERLLRPGGVAAVICPTAWMHVGYGARLTSYLVEKYDVLAVIRSEVERWFPDASVDAGIVLLGKPRARPAGNSVPVVRLRKSLSEVPWGVIAAALDETRSKTRAWSGSGGLEVVTAECGRLRSGNWSPVFHPAPLKEFLAAAGASGRLRRLGDIASVRRGFTTGANGFFYVTPVREESGAPREHRRLTSVVPCGLRGSGRAFELPDSVLHPLIRSPREIRGYRVRPGDIRHLVVLIRADDAPVLRDEGDCAAYIEWGEMRGFARRPTCASRSPWWSLRPAPPPPVVWAMTIRERFFAAMNCGALLDARMYGISPAGGRDAVLLAAILNSSIVALQAEQGCRTYGGGGGPLDTKVYEVRSLLVPDPSLLQPADAEAILSPFREMMSRDVLSVGEECAMEDRARLDEAVLRACGVPAARVEPLAREARNALCESVAGRTGRAKRVISP